MARKFITPIKDASIYEGYPNRNAGADEIIEVGKSSDGTDTIRSLIQFDIAGELSGAVPGDASYYLNIRLAKASNLQGIQLVNFYEVSQSWEEGSGYVAQDLVNPDDGVSWNKRFAQSGSFVVSASISYSSDVWGSASNPVYGGITGSYVNSWGFGWKPADVRLDITSLVGEWISGSKQNNGLLLKLSDAEEQNENVKANIKFFSRQTHTVFLPTIEAVWNTQTINTSGSGLYETPDEFELFTTNARRLFVTGSTYRIRFGARSMVPVKSFEDTFRYGNKYFLPSGSYLGVVDAATSTYVIPFDTGSLISADTTGSYCDLKIENMFINRTYKLQVMVNKPWGPEVMDTHQNFQVVLWHR